MLGSMIFNRDTAQKLECGCSFVKIYLSHHFWHNFIFMSIWEQTLKCRHILSNALSQGLVRSTDFEHQGYIKAVVADAQWGKLLHDRSLQKYILPQGGIHIPRGQRRGVHEMTMNDHKGEGFRNDHVVRWTEFFLFLIRKWLHEFSIWAVTCRIFGIVM